MTFLSVLQAMIAHAEPGNITANERAVSDCFS
jgi:hypothetical protein